MIAMAATNRPDVLDPALIRQGRFDRTIELDLPDRPARLEILKLHAEGKRLAEDANLDAIAGLTRGCRAPSSRGDERGGPAHSPARSADDHAGTARGGPRAGRHGHRGQARALRGRAAAGRLSRGGTRARRPRTPGRSSAAQDLDRRPRRVPRDHLASRRGRPQGAQPLAAHRADGNAAGRARGGADRLRRARRRRGQRSRRGRAHRPRHGHPPGDERCPGRRQL